MALNSRLKEALGRVADYVNPADGLGAPHYLQQAVRELDEAIQDGGSCGHLDDVYMFLKEHKRRLCESVRSDIYLVYRTLRTIRGEAC